MTDSKRMVVWFSCGAASAVAAYLTVKEWRDRREIELVYTDPGSEHPDNKRFLRDCEEWLYHPVRVLKSDKYADTWDVFARERYLVGVKGARCTTELKKRLRQEFEDLTRDVQVFGYTSEEQDRADRFRDNNPEVATCFPLIDNMMTKADCLALIRQVGIELPAMYKMGYRNNNCIGCVKGGAGYWNKIRRDWPDVFTRMAGVERDIDAAINKRYRPAKDGEECDSRGLVRERVFLDELPPDMGKYESEPDIECGVLCVMALSDDQ
ncbi:MAG: phosphoadenosine phosphosulfate reductase family protein [bacterium]|nr:phosphoadenosine phosphosulfate reductase family protein [bacterium]